MSYEGQTVNARFPLARFSHRARIREAVSQVCERLPAKGTALDYGAGPGLLFVEVASKRPDARLMSYEPFQSEVAVGAESHITRDIATVQDCSVDLVCCLETLEHCTDAEIDQFLADVRRILRPGGRVLISVPIIGGPGILVKAANAYFVHRSSEYTPRELLRLVRGPQHEENRPNKLAHKGFDFRILEGRLAADLMRLERWWSPFRRLPWWGNSQVFTLWAAPEDAPVGDVDKA